MEQIRKVIYKQERHRRPLGGVKNNEKISSIAHPYLQCSRGSTEQKNTFCSNKPYPAREYRRNYGLFPIRSNAPLRSAYKRIAKITSPL